MRLANSVLNDRSWTHARRVPRPVRYIVHCVYTRECGLSDMGMINVNLVLSGVSDMNV